MPMREFYAVTITGSVYKVCGIRDVDTENPVIIKIASNGNPCKDTARRNDYPEGHYVGILYGMLCRFGRRHETPCLPRGVDPGFWPWRSSTIAALFLSKEAAVNCSMESDLQLYDQRWKVATDTTLTAIGKQHPIFVIAEKPWEPQ